MSSKYRDVCPDTVKRLEDWAAARCRNPKDADKAVKTALHQITGAFMTESELKRAKKLLVESKDDPARALADTLGLHASTRERLPHVEAFYEALLGPLDAHRLLDLACGLNPLYLGSRGYAVRGIDISGGCVALVNDWAAAQGWDVSAECADLLCGPSLPAADAALAMKLLPVLEQQEKGAAMALLRRVPAPVIIVTFPLKTLGGRSVGMESHYTEWFEAASREDFDILRREALFGELCYTVRRKAG
ncbi:MAG: Rmt family 16S rRNA (guanine(1405)-N(7))-methyltransferase [Clostridia bacterium]|nr:Rmt family 16S rRNA (guanine(1405)-N(7))-methyltransferase [Clostridia bacterium]